MAKFILTIDQGTTGTTASLINSQGFCAARADEDFAQIFPKPGWVEHSPEAIWGSVISTVQKVMSKARANSHDIAAIGITNQRETVVVWDRKTGKPVYNAIVWQCRRTTQFCEQLRKKKASRDIPRRTGLVVDPYFSASKIKWILDNVQGAKKKAKDGLLVAGTIDTYLLWRLTGGRAFKTDLTNASRTMLMNIKTICWDDKLLELFSVPRTMLPEIKLSNSEFGKTHGLGFLPDGVPITGMVGDQQSALFGQTCFKAGEAKCTFGTGSFLLMNTGNKIVHSRKGLVTTVAWQLKGEKKPTYALEGGAFICGAAVQWLRDGLHLIRESSEIEKLAAEVPDAGGVEFVPALSGLGAPHWDARARGSISGITRGSTRAHLARATLEGMALQNAEILFAMQSDLGKKMKSLRVDGGAAANDLLMQLQADYLGVGIIRPQMIETTSNGAAYMAGLGVGFWNSVADIQKVWRVDREFAAQLSKFKRKERLKNWEKAVRRARL